MNALHNLDVIGRAVAVIAAVRERHSSGGRRVPDGEIAAALQKAGLLIADPPKSRGTARCPECGRDVVLRGNGVLFRHKAYGSGQVCSRSGSFPVGESR